ncbi:MAG: pyridoxamine 5'-phosphate oxidase family protein [Actinomycetota bacterium]|nr:pyridoxamine 5'-phosphate oxidase family protein [Actinomycetota bacterium]
MSQRTLVELGREECLQLLGTQTVGRVAYCDQAGAIAVPVNFGLAGDDVVVRMESTNLALPRLGTLAFEADQIDVEQHSGWSVVVRGSAEEIALDDVPALLQQMRGDPPTPWADGIHNVWVRIRSSSVTGRRLGGSATPLVM